MTQETMKTVHVHIALKQAVLDPQGKAIEAALQAQGYDMVDNVRQGKLIEFQVPATMSDEEILQNAEKMCASLLANPVMEDYKISIQGTDSHAGAHKAA